jgi:hypothetical protein
MDKEFVQYEEALKLKELGFHEPCFGYFNVTEYLGIGSFVFGKCDKDTIDGYGYHVLLRPTFQQAFRWFREKHGLIGLPRRDSSRNYNGWWFQIFRQNIESENPIELYELNFMNFDAYEDAESVCLKRLIEILSSTK